MGATEKDQEYRDFFTSRHLVDATRGQGMPREFRFSANKIEVEAESDSALLYTGLSVADHKEVFKLTKGKVK